ncbi:MAG: hypothetical protein WCJ72_10195 [Chryseobacterium sp.]|jgi:hypothetical protein
MKLFYSKLIATFKKEEIKDKYRTSGVKPPQFIDIYAGQDYNPGAFEAFNFPALLVEWTIDYKSSPPVASINFHLCYEQLRDTSSLGKNTAEALKFLDFTEITDHVLKTIETEHTGKLSLISEGNKLDDTVVDVYNLSYQCSYTGKMSAPNSGYIKGEIENLTAKRQGLYTQLLGD